MGTKGQALRGTMRVGELRKSKQILEQALNLHQTGHLREASVLYEDVLLVEPENAEALHLSGLIAHQQGRVNTAVERIGQAIHLRPQSKTFVKNLCAVLLASGRANEAACCYQKLVALVPGDAEAWFGLGNLYQQQGQVNEAVQAYRQVIALQPDHVGAHHNLGAAYQAQGDHEHALACFQSALQIDPTLAQVYFSQSNVYLATDAWEDAAKALQRALQIQPDHVEARFNLANLCKDTGKAEMAIANYVALLKQAPAMAEAHNNLGNVFYSIEQEDQALQCYQAALKIRPDYPEALYNSGIVLQNQGQYDAAMAHCHKAIALNPEYASAYAGLVHQARQACAWEGLAGWDQKVDQFTSQALAENRRPAENPFLNICRHADPALNAAVARAWSRDVAQKVRALVHGDPSEAVAKPSPGPQTRRLKIGYLSNNFRNHPTAHLLTRLFRLHDRERFEIYGYSYGPDDGSVYRRQIEQGCDRFVELNGIDDFQAVGLMQAHNIDILVDLVGYMQGHRMGICAQRPAPIQVRYLGMAGTSGADFFDYLIADRVVVPEAQAPYYQEKLVYLPHCYQINDDRQPVADVHYSHQDFKLPSDALVYCSFASHYKLDPIMFAAWMRILHQVQASVLWLTPGSQTAERNLKAQAEHHGINPARLVFADRMPKAQHLARLKLAHLALDTRLVGGAATTSDALWSGVPVITLQGDHFASRMSASLLKAMGLEELITRALDEYETLAVTLGRNPDMLKALQQKVHVQKKSGNLFNSVEMVRHLERAFKIMWQNFEKHGQAQTIRL